ncbi:uncharacterized protein LOC135695997 isoform X1 [Rhopilema esculentum]|uniref:uncharacterized protein LOC135695997 isoform X1 n=1 Tax=Rhopilema esculentum TaxID=499914 RepID=UPI0031CEF45B
MESNGFQNNHNKNQRLRSTVFNSRSRVQSREQSPVKSYKSFLPVSTFTTNGSFGISAEGNRNSRETRKNAMMFNSPATRRTFHQAAGLSTADQGLIQKRSPWNGTSFVNDGAKERSFRFAAVKNIFNRKTYSDPEVRHNNGWLDEKNSDISTETSTRSSGSLKTVHLSFHMDSALTERRPAKNKVFLLSDSSLARMKKASSIYIDKNTAFHKQRKKQIEKL